MFNNVPTNELNIPRYCLIANLNINPHLKISNSNQTLSTISNDDYQ